jgi:hypothetical protein
VEDRALDLVGDERRLEARAEELELRGGVVGDAHGLDAALGHQRVQRLGSLGCVHQRVGTVDQEEVEMVGAEVFQRPVDRAADVGGRGVVVTDTMLGASR